MLGKLLGAAAGAEASKFTTAFGGPAGAAIGVLAVPLVRRLSIPGLIVVTVGGYFAKKWLDRREAQADAPTATRKAAVKKAASARKSTRRAPPKASAASA